MKTVQNRQEIVVPTYSLQLDELAYTHFYGLHYSTTGCGEKRRNVFPKFAKYCTSKFLTIRHSLNCMSLQVDYYNH